MATSAQAAMAEGLDELDSELGETFVLAVSEAEFTGRLETANSEQLGDYAGVVRETKLHVKREQEAFAEGLPAVGSVIVRSSDNTSARLSRIGPGNHGRVVFVLTGEFE